MEQQDLEAMADQLLAEDAAKREKEDSKSRKKLDDKTIAALPAATLITANEKLKDLLAKGCKTGKLDPGELSDVVDTMDLDGDQMDHIYDSLADLGIEVGSDEFLTDLPDDGEPPLEEIAEIEEEELVDPNTLVDSFNIDDPVRMYLKEIGKVNLLTSDEEIDLAQAMGAGAEAKEQMEELEQAGVTGYVGKVNMDRNGLPGILQETTEESVRETLRWLKGCHFDHVKPILTPRFTPSCTDELMAALGRLAQEKGLYVQSHLSENLGEIQWVKELHPDCILFFRLGDFYEMFYDDALTASRELELTLTGKNCGREERAPMCGVPFHSYETYMARLVAKGYKVAICEQIEDPALAKGLVKRDIIRVVTPGTVIESSMLREDKNNYLASIFCKRTRGRWRAGVCFADISTGEAYATELNAEKIGGAIITELCRYMPSEILICPPMLDFKGVTTYIKQHTNALVELREDACFKDTVMESTMADQFGANWRETLGYEKDALVPYAVAALLNYLHETQKHGVERIHQDRAELRRRTVYAPVACDPRQFGTDRDDARPRKARHAAVGAGQDRDFDGQAPSALLDRATAGGCRRHQRTAYRRAGTLFRQHRPR